MTNRTVYRSNYQPYGFQVEETKLVFDIQEGVTTVQSDLQVKVSGSSSELQLDGEAVELENIAVDGRTLLSNEYRVDEESLTIFNVPLKCVVFIICSISNFKSK